METRFNIAQPADTETLISLMREYYVYDHIPFDESLARAALARLTDDETLGRIWLIEQGDQAIGYLAITLGYSLEYGRDAFIDEVYLREPYRGQGLGQRAFTLAEEACRALGVQALHLEVERDNGRAQAFYRKIGYEDHDRYLLTKRLDEGG
jgi:ribosomal protein S18 acetylase RimI-like enzyme